MVKFQLFLVFYGRYNIGIGNNNLIKIKLKLLFFIEMLNSIITWQFHTLCTYKKYKPIA